jgi:predicted metal-dependent hydrolase
MNNEAKTNTRIEFLKKKEQEIRTKLAAEQAKNRRRAERETVRAVEVVGKAVMQMADENPLGFGLMLKQVLDTAVTDERARELLRGKGLL